MQVQELQRLLVSTEQMHVLLLDVRTPAEYAAERIAGSINVPLQDVGRHIDALKSYDAVYVYCQSGRRSQEASRMLEDAGVAVENIEGGIAEWKTKGFATLRSRKALPVMQQVLLIAGLLVLVGAAGTLWLSDWFLLLVGFVGAGLAFAGVSGHCMMAYLLGYMPWNKTISCTLPWEK